MTSRHCQTQAARGTGDAIRNINFKRATTVLSHAGNGEVA
eukprot:CAMPEP_0179213972 /NCGR_PEP_ID=MMETSP0797-20121207/2011_1 /TAXON_ID=47934 /ORGANISM="Dinophysis acuminata, Strain DAEP01" /LENGTH=39 /DNA_ID= /DNA_START= /DNA_END= /DNA_ORIENTATION=